MEYSQNFGQSGNFNLSSSSFHQKDSGFKFKPFSSTNSGFNENSMQSSLNPHGIIRYANQIIKEEEWEQIYSQVSSIPNVHTLELSGINIDDFGLRRLGEIVKENDSIKTLRIEWDYLNEHQTAFEYFCECVANSQLTYLYLNNNKINSALAKNLAKLVNSSQNLFLLDLKWNETGNEGAQALVSALTKNRNLQELNIRGNKFNSSYQNKIDELITRNKNYNPNSNNEEEPYLSRTFQNGTSRSPDKTKNEFSTKEQDNIPYKFLEKEKEMSEEFKARYDVQVAVNAKLEKRTKELETVLDLERKKLSEYKSNFDSDLSKERQTRASNEEKIRELKERLVEKEIEINKLKDIIDFNSKSHSEEIANIKKENDSLKECLTRNSKIYQENVTLIKNENEKISNYLRECIDSLKHENEKIKRESKEEINLNFQDFQKKFKNLEDCYLKLKYSKEEIEKDNNETKKEILDLKIKKETEIKEIEERLKQEEKMKNEAIFANNERKTQFLERIKDDYEEKNAYLFKEIDSLKKKITDKEMENELKNNKSQSEIISLTKSNSNLLSERTKYETQIKSQEALINKLKANLKDNETKLETYMQEKEKSFEDFNEQVTCVKIENQNKIKILETKLTEREKTINQLKAKIGKMENHDIKYAEQLKSSLFKMVDDHDQL